MKQKTLKEFRALVADDEKTVGFRIMDEAGHNDGRVYEFIGPEDMDARGDSLGAIEETLHRMLDAGYDDDSIEHFLGAIKRGNTDMETCTYIDLDYILPGVPYAYDFERDKQRKDLYRRYKFAWLSSHNHTIEELVESVMNHAEATYGDPFFHPYKQLVEDWEKECGFDGEIYPSYSEFIATEYLDPKVMLKLCSNDSEQLRYLVDQYFRNAENWEE